ncbi:hypothetical protein LUZ61_020664 [Rhynchospora tenuis]|uniref:Uncharacterized protein n=1 Tax=Rhynchospora tenuis TaxID=198213 RepID=A0AAD6EP05_9POAL|nr:hypothetical protein LUZ61_020664 [Rhynchospora tenuis]
MIGSLMELSSPGFQNRSSENTEGIGGIGKERASRLPYVPTSNAIIDNLLVTVVASIWYRALVENAHVAFYKRPSIMHLIKSCVSNAIQKDEAEKIIQIKQAEGDAESKRSVASLVGSVQQNEEFVDSMRRNVLAIREIMPEISDREVLELFMKGREAELCSELAH